MAVVFTCLQAQWDLAEEDEVFDCTGIFNVKCSYKINQGARMIVDLNDHEIRPGKGSRIPSDVPGLVGKLDLSPTEHISVNIYICDHVMFTNSSIFALSIVGLLHRAFPKEMFDPNGHAIDTTYLDADFRVVRLTGPHHEGVRNIFMRKGSFEINPAND